MGHQAAAIWAVIALATAGTAAAQTPAPAAPAAASHIGDIPQAIRLDHEETIRHLTVLSHRRSPVGAVAAKALDVMRRHQAQEREFILPPLTLLQSLTEGKISPDMKWAIGMADRVKTEREQIFAAHVKITELMNELLHAADRAHDRDAREFAESAVAGSLNDMEIQEPTTILIGEYLRAKLPSTP
jgi:hypothetical protein